jgi:tetratricopeptide (TPR) repeat protein
MSFFDPQDKKNKPVLDYFENKTWLIVDSSSSTRTSIKKSIAQIGAKMSNIIDADNLKDAQSIMQNKHPQFVIGFNHLNGGDLAELYNIHMQSAPNRLQAGFFILAEEETIPEIAVSLDYEMDGIVALPFTGFTIIDTVLSGTKHKINPSPYVSKLEEGRAAIIANNLERASELLTSALELHAHPYEAYFFLGQIYNSYNLIERAVIAFEESHFHNADYFRALKHLSVIYFQTKDYKKAYDINFIMAQKYPILPEKIPELIRLSIINKKYEDINNYLKVFKEMKTANAETQISLAAGLAVLGKYFVMNNEKQKGIEALKTAFKFSNGKFEILNNLIATFEECQRLNVMLELFEAADLSIWPDNVQGLYFYTLHAVSPDDAQVIAVGEQILRKKVKDAKIYVGLIERSIKMRRKIGNIESLVLEACKYFPERKMYFEQMLETAKKSA